MEPQLILEIWKKRWQIPLTKEKEAEFKSKVVFFGLDKFDRTRLIAAIDQHRHLKQISNSLNKGANPRATGQPGGKARYGSGLVNNPGKAEATSNDRCEHCNALIRSGEEHDCS
jgi:hypothetical protein